MARWAVVAMAVGCGHRDPDPCALEAHVDSIDAALATLEALPQPVSLPCFLTSLARPLGVVFTSDVFNTQPAEGFRSPRILLRNRTLAMTLVPVGEAKNLLEFGEDYSPDFTLKGELEFPVEGPVDPYVRTLAFPGATESGCHVCHFDEVALGEGRFANTPLRPPSELVVPLELLRKENDHCDAVDDPNRCAIFSALFDHGEVTERPFPEEVATQFGPAP